MTIRVSTADAPAGEPLDYWQDVVCSTFFQADCEAPRDQPFHGAIDTTMTPQIALSRLRSGAQRVVRTAEHVRRTADEVFLVNVQLSGVGTFSQDGREAVLRPGDFTCSDSTRPCAMTYSGDFEQLVFHMPRSLVTALGGRTEHLTAMPIRSESAVGALVAPFLTKLGAGIAELGSGTATRLAEIGLALTMTALGEMAGADVNRQEWGRLALRQRAGQWIDANARDARVNPAMVAAAVGISQRYLQALFRDDDTTAAEAIWRRRLELSRRDLSDPLLAAVGISQVAFGCGFSDLAHFSRRFKAAYDLSPRAFRAAMIWKGGDGPAG